MQRHCEHLPALTMNDYFEQLIMMNDDNGAVGASGTDPSTEHTFVFLFLFTGFLVWLTSNKIEYIYIYMSSQYCCYIHGLNLTKNYLIF
jgi:hypothetical protein